MATISRNQLCPCNSGKKYKHCHGSYVPEPDPLSNDVDTFLSRLRKRYDDRANALIKAYALDESHFVETYLDENETLDAYAAIEGGINVVKIHLGAVFLLRDLFDQMLSHPKNFPHVGLAGGEMARGNYQPRRQTFDLSTIAQRNWQP